MTWSNLQGAASSRSQSSSFLGHVVLVRYKLSRVALGTSVCLCQFASLSLMVPLISTQVVWLIVTLKPYDITHLFFRFKIMCALTYVQKKNQWKSTLNWSLLKKKKFSTIFLDNLFSILLLFTRIGFKFRNWKITALLWLLPMVEQQACWCHRVVYKQRRKCVKYRKRRK